MTAILAEILFIFQRFTFSSLVDILLVTVLFFAVLSMLKDTQAMVLVRGLVVLVVGISFLTTLVNLPAFGYLARSVLPALLFAIPVIFAPEIRRALERIGRAGGNGLLSIRKRTPQLVIDETIKSVVSAAARLASQRQGALIVIQNDDNLSEYINTGVRINARVTPELLMQIFYPNTPLHDGAAILIQDQVAAAACVIPLSSSGVLNTSPERQMGLRHRAALGMSEASDALIVIVSEEAGIISLAHRGKLIRRIGADRLEHLLKELMYTKSDKQEPAEQQAEEQKGKPDKGEDHE